MVIRTPPGFSALDTLSAPEITTKINEVLRPMACWLLDNKHKWTNLFCPECKTYPTRFPVILHAVPTSFDPTNPSHLQALGTQNKIDPTLLQSAQWLGDLVNQGKKNGSLCKNSLVCNKCMGDHNPISCKASLPSPPVCCICISHEKIASKKSVNTLDERLSHHPWSHTCPQMAQEI
ncbi:hypothetical protein CROQUDRAFT_663847 [Cronartium quercuum f. sp. fusiforme G11]|uniref:Uncharacterized protein n=1 Tax=Cronartium quercuum f. sp. fusiforme G11 TaxID=708437 RepID=A0A9P6N873_9BASI|nr:hypothetical protein CROQUDRAFT_663847 [Cronartium quercuum f. sp. fusiforme G11]